MKDIKSFSETGELFDSRYQLLNPLSTENDPDVVWLARDVNSIEKYNVAKRSPNQLVTIKICFQNPSLYIEEEQRLQDEFDIAHQCRHPNLVPPEQYSSFEDFYYLVFPYQEKGSLRQCVGKSISVKSTWKLIHDIASGLNELHTHQPHITHQSINPSNILIVADGTFALSNYGIHFDQDDSQTTLTKETSANVTAYMAPERFQAHLPFSPESDIWAFGATLYEVLTGNKPFGKSGGKNQQDDTPMPPLPDQPSEICDLIYACLQANPQKRPTARQIKDAARFKKFAANRTKKQPTQKAKKPTDVEHGKKKNNSLLAIVSVAIVIIGTLVFLLSHNHDKEPIEKEKPSETVNYYDKACHLLMKPNSADSGLKLLDSLVKAKNWQAVFLTSRLYFDTQGTDTIFYDQKWEQMRINCGIAPDKTTAHKYLYDAFTLNENDFMILYHLGCDYKAGTQRGCSRNLDYALWCFDKAEAILSNTGTQNMRYRYELNNGREGIIGHSPVKPEW